MKGSIGGLPRYAWAAGFVSVALLVKLILRACWGVEAPFLLFLAAVLASAWLGGLGPGLLATALSVFAAEYFFVAPFGRPPETLAHAGQPTYPPLLMFAAEAAVVSVLSGLRKRDRDLLRGKIEELRVILHSIDTAVLTTDAQGRVTFLNPAAEAMAAGARPGLPLPDELPRGPLARALAGAPGEGEEVRLGEGQGAAWLRVRAAPIRGRDGAPAGAVVVLDDVTRERRADEARRCRLLERLATIQEDERRHLARDLHDEAGQQLTALSLGLKAARQRAVPQEEALARLQRLAEDAIGSLHRLACRLRPAALDGLGLEAALRQCLDGWSQSGAPPVDFQCSLGDTKLPDDVQTHVYRIVSEAFTNVVKHAGARRVGVILQLDGKQLLAIVEDDGRGFDPADLAKNAGRAGRLGLCGMRERAALLGGTLEVESAPGRGTTVFVRVPLPAAPGDMP